MNNIENHFHVIFINDIIFSTTQLAVVFLLHRLCCRATQVSTCVFSLQPLKTFAWGPKLTLTIVVATCQAFTVRKHLCVAMFTVIHLGLGGKHIFCIAVPAAIYSEQK